MTTTTDPKPAASGSAAARAVADGDDSTKAQAAALAYFMGEEPAPGSRTRIPLDVDFGTLEAPNLQRCVFRALASEEFDKCAELAEEKENGEVVRVNPIVRWSYVFAYACVEPQLGPILAARQESEQDPEVKKRLTDAGALVREVFRFQPGVIQKVAQIIDRRSRMDPDDRSVIEVEAGKGSP